MDFPASGIVPDAPVSRRRAGAGRRRAAAALRSLGAAACIAFFLAFAAWGDLVAALITGVLR